MTILNVSFGIFAFMPQGWIFMAFVILCECALTSKLLTGNWKNQKIFLSISGTNIISGLIGIFASMKLNGGWYLVVWFPWISNNEVNIQNRQEVNGMMMYYLTAFIVSLIVESISNYFFLRKQFATRQIIKTTVIANTITYLVGSIVLYTYSFGLL